MPPKYRFSADRRINRSFFLRHALFLSTLCTVTFILERLSTHYITLQMLADGSPGDVDRVHLLVQARANMLLNFGSY